MKIHFLIYRKLTLQLMLEIYRNPLKKYIFDLPTL